MVYNTQNHWVSELYPSAGILSTIKYCICVTDPEILVFSQGNNNLLMGRHSKHLFIKLGMHVIFFFLIRHIHSWRKPGISSRVIVFYKLHLLHMGPLSCFLSNNNSFRI
jgi:hypothetical protein